MNPDQPVPPRPLHGRFKTTRWSVVLSCVDTDGDTQKMHTALAELCKIYWRPVFAFIRRVGHSPPDAQDLTQDFFVIVLRGQLLQRANPARGRFRSLVLKALEDFLRDAEAKRSARKRGGDVDFVSWTIGCPKRHRISRFLSRNPIDGRRRRFSMCAGRPR